MYKIKANQLNDLLSGISEQKELYVPQSIGDNTSFSLWKNGEVNYNFQGNTERSPKDYFFPQVEGIASFKMEGKKIDIIEPENIAKDAVFFGVRPCDVKSLEILDLVFLSDPVDTFYQSRRESGIIVSLACNKPEETCFCSVFDIDATDPTGDVTTWIVGEYMYWDAKTDKGETLTRFIQNLSKGFMEECNDQDKRVLESSKEETMEILNRLPLNNIGIEGIKNRSSMNLFEDTRWEEWSKACLGCGTCTYLCPTCQCYDIKDFDAGHEVQRYRCWDSCMYSDFTMMAHGNNRNSQVERFRQRFMHKLSYFPENNDGTFSCVGCGRCLQKCPVSMNIAKVAKSLGGLKND